MAGLKEFMDRMKREAGALGEAVQTPNPLERPDLNQKYGLRPGQTQPIEQEMIQQPKQAPHWSNQPSAQDPAMREQILQQLRAAQEASQAAGQAEELKMQQAEQADQEQYARFPKIKKQFGQ